MLRIIAGTSAGQAKSYFSTADYYTEGQELTGQWRGEAAKRLGLSGAIMAKDWDRLCDNRHPQTAEKLTLRTKEQRRVGYDFNFHVPKSLSVLYGLTEDEQLLAAFRESVNETMRDMEAEMQTRVRKRGQNQDRTTGNLVWGEFVHLTSRPVNGIPDPHLHAHCFAMNVTYDEQEHAWKAGQFGNLKRDAPYFEAKFHSRLGRRLADLGIEVERTRTGWEIAGISPSIIGKFSRRTQEIEEEARKRGITDPALKAELGAKTRERKQKHLTRSELRQEWMSRLTEDERDSLASAAARVGGPSLAESRESARAGISMAADHCFERQSVVPERTLLAESLKRSVGKASLQTVEQEFHKENFLIRERHCRRMATTTAVLAEEQAMIGFAREGRGTRPQLGKGHHDFSRKWLNEGQRQAVEHVLSSRDRVMLIRGAAGTGKTSMMQEAVEAIESSGKHVFTFAPSARASRGVLKDHGFQNADTVARLLVDEQLQQATKGQVIWIDEAGMIGSRTITHLFGLADRLDARVILSGDRRQHGSVERGSPLRLLEEEAGLVPAEIKEIQRQQKGYKQAVLALSEGRITDGFRQLDEMHWIREVPTTERYRILAIDYVDTMNRGETALVISPTHLEGERCTNAIREGLKSNGRLEIEERRFATLYKSDLTEGERRDAVNYSPGDVLVFHQNAKGFTKGQRVEIGDTPPPLDQAARFQLFHPGFLDIAEGEVLRITHNGKTLDGRGRLNNGDLLHVTGFDKSGNILTQEKKTIAKEFGHLDYGYVTTSHGSQGTDVNRVLIGQSADSFPASNTAQFYVSVSRGQKQATIYTDHKADLLDAVRRSDDRISATELLSRDMIAERAPATRERNPFDRALHTAQHERQKEELIHER